MRFPAVSNATIRSAQWIAASDMAIAAWTKLCFRASEDENGGRFGGASTWGESIWLPMANVTMAAIDAAVAAGLCSWDGDSLVVNGYDRPADKKLTVLRKNGKFGHLGGRPKKPSRVIEAKPKGLPNQNPLTFPSPPLPSLTLPNQEEKKTEPAAPAVPSPREFIAVFCEEWPAIYVGETYRPTPKDAGQVAALLKANPTLTVNEFREGCRRYVDSQTPFYVSQRHPLALLALGFNEFSGAAFTPLPPKVQQSRGTLRQWHAKGAK